MKYGLILFCRPEHNAVKPKDLSTTLRFGQDDNSKLTDIALVRDSYTHDLQLIIVWDMKYGLTPYCRPERNAVKSKDLKRYIVRIQDPSIPLRCTQDDSAELTGRQWQQVHNTLCVIAVINNRNQIRR